MQNNIAPDGSPTDITADTGRIWRCTADGAVTALSEDRFGITNTFCWTNGGGLVTADTLQNALYRYAIDPVTHQFSDRHIYLQGFDRGLPDGSTMDAEGYIWNCRVAGGGCVVRIDPEGRIDRVIDLPCSWPTSCAFGGPGLDTLFVTSARFSMTADHIAGHPQEGGLFAVKTGVTGVPCHRFG
jgi:sugar lactone lactonase YvrE